MPSPTPVITVSRRDRLVISTCLVLLIALAWAYLLHLQRQMSSAMDHETMMAEMGMAMEMPWGPADVFFTFAMWTVMMIGMMGGSAAPVLLLFASAQARRSESGVSAKVLMFGLGYLLVWTAFSGFAAIAQAAMHQVALLSPTMAAASTPLAGGILLVSGAYQLSPWKGACLSHCRSPLGFLMATWRDGTVGALQMGARHGLFCVGCCWALMCVLFAVGVMNLLWVAGLTIFVMIEKLGPAGAFVSKAAGALLVLAGGFLMIGATG